MCIPSHKGVMCCFHFPLTQLIEDVPCSLNPGLQLKRATPPECVTAPFKGISRPSAVQRTKPTT